MGLVTGAFALYAHAIMPGLKTTDDRTFVAAFQSIDRAIINPWFMLTGFAGALVLTAVALVTQLGKDPLPYVAAALALYVVVVVITVAVNVPLNDAIKAATNLDDATAIRERFHEARWAAFNLVRVVASSLAFLLLAYSLVVYGRSA
ncbi:putative membrane protein [Solirubrobacter pauli]|uniref:Putative membrane protein n=2 Tax=Solirubrobacter pauli TaxID=166793 RepID=A0A660KWJ0_9ACTN|nr:putative membrane protein [Solirubrobacter pauli]